MAAQYQWWKHRGLWNLLPSHRPCLPTLASWGDQRMSEKRRKHITWWASIGKNATSVGGHQWEKGTHHTLKDMNFEYGFCAQAYTSTLVLVPMTRNFIFSCWTGEARHHPTIDYVVMATTYQLCNGHTVPSHQLL